MSQATAAIAIIDGVEIELGELIERGGMAEVYAGWWTDGTELAIKRLRPELAMQSDFVAMFLDEAAISRGMRHPNIVRTLGAGSCDELPALAMERLRGPSVLELIHRRRGEPPADLATSVLIGYQIAGALAYAHGLAAADGRPLQVVHRDVSPSNIIVDSRGSAILFDFGIARAIERLAERTRTGLLKGKDGYMSPEQCIGSRVDHRSDIFSLGIVLYELCTGRALFRRDPVENSFTVMERVTSGRIPEAPLDGAGIDGRIKDIVLRCLDPEPAERYATAADLARDLAPLVESLTNEPASSQSTRLAAMAGA